MGFGEGEGSPSSEGFPPLPQSRNPFPIHYFLRLSSTSRVDASM